MGITSLAELEAAANEGRIKNARFNFGFIAQPKQQSFFKPSVTREAMKRCGIRLDYASRPCWPVYKALLDAVRAVRFEIASMRPRDMIDMQS